MSDVATSTVPVQAESIESGNPVSESALFAIAGPINYSLKNIAQVGDVVMSALDQSTFQSLRDTTWVLADGRSVIGSAYQSLTGQANIPDFRGRFPRAKDNGGGVDPDGDLPIGNTRNYLTASHNHTVNDPGHHHTYQAPNGGSGGGSASGTSGQAPVTPTSTAATGITLDPFGGNETRPKCIVINFFIKINV